MVPNNISISTLSNGLKLITIDQPWNEGVYCYAFVKVGSCDEQLEVDKGICHFLEHLVFRGTEEYTEEQITKLTTGKGGFINAATSYLSTLFQTWAQPEFLGTAISIMDNIVNKPLLQSDTMEIERKIIVEEAKEQESDPFQQMIIKNNHNLFLNHNCKYPIIGTEQSINQITSTRMKEYLRGYYRPQNIIVVLCGNIPEQSKLEDILYKNAQGFVRKTRAASTSIIERKHGDFSTLDSDIEEEETWKDIKSSNSITSYGFDASQIFKKDVAALRILSGIIGGSNNSLMFKKIRQDEGLCYDCGSHASIIGNSVGNISMYACSRKENIQKIEEITDQIIKDVCKGKFTKTNMEESKNNILGRTMRALESGDNMALAIGNGMLINDPNYSIFPWEYKEIYKKITKEQVVDMAQKILTNPKARYKILNE